MGCDGGTIPKRHELVKGPKKVEKVKFTYLFSPLNSLLFSQFTTLLFSNANNWPAS